MINTEQLVFFLLLIVSIGLALWKGGAPERWGAVVILTMVGIAAVAEVILPSGFRRVDPFSLLTDLVGTLGFGWLALQALRIWPLWATSLQLLSLSAHFARWADLGIPPLVYAVMRGTPTGFALLALILGTILHLRRLRRDGSDRSWQDWSRATAGSDRFHANYSKHW